MDQKFEIIWRAFIITFSVNTTKCLFFYLKHLLQFLLKMKEGIFCCDTILLKCEVLQLIICFFL